MFVSREPDLGWVSVVGWVGVDLFFVLSGYLIANQIMAGVVAGRRLSLTAFYARRVWRTWPLFWLVLALYFAFPAAFGGRTPPPLWRFLTFTQNLGLQPGTAFSHAWSLCIEEQFYLALPLVFLVGRRLQRGGVVAGWALLIGLVLFGMAIRTTLWWRYGSESTGHIDGYYPFVYYATLCRFDEFLPGVAVAMLQNFHRPLWERLTRQGPRMTIAGVIATGTLLFAVKRYYYVDDVGYGFFMTAFGYSLLAMAFAWLVIAALSPASWLHRVRVPGARRLALWSYAIYLSHKAVGFALQRHLQPLQLSPMWTLLTITLASLATGWLLHRLIEAPLMALRDRLVPTSFATASRLKPPATPQPAPATPLASPPAAPAARRPAAPRG